MPLLTSSEMKVVEEFVEIDPKYLQKLLRKYYHEYTHKLELELEL